MKSKRRSIINKRRSVISKRQSVINERRSVISIRTKFMSSEVYRILNNKSKNINELPAYINRLVEEDLYRERRNCREDELLALIREMRKELEALRREIMLRPTMPAGYQEIMAVEEKAVREEDFTEGQLVYEEEVTGKIEEEIDFDL